jgi:hypothetical protein
LRVGVSKYSKQASVAIKKPARLTTATVIATLNTGDSPLRESKLAAAMPLAGGLTES